MPRDSVFLFVAVAVSRLMSRAGSWCAGIARQLSHGLVLAAVARAAGPGATVVERRAEWTLPLSAIEPGDCAGWKFVEAGDRASLAEEWQRAVQTGQCDVERTARRWSNRSQVEDEGMNFVPAIPAAARASAEPITSGTPSRGESSGLGSGPTGGADAVGSAVGAGAVGSRALSVTPLP